MTREEWEEAKGYNEAEHYLVDAIKRHLLTSQQHTFLSTHSISIEDMLNGRVEGYFEQTTCDQIFEEWNKKLGWKEFGF